MKFEVMSDEDWPYVMPFESVPAAIVQINNCKTLLEVNDVVASLNETYGVPLPSQITLTALHRIELIE